MPFPARRVRVLSAALVTAAASVAVWRLRRGWAVITVEGPSMEPTFRHGDRVAVRRKPPFVISSGDVVVIERPYLDHERERPPGRIHERGRLMIKRVHATSGDPVPAGIPVPDSVVPHGKLILLGDNPSSSFDSRVSGYFPADHVLGGVVRRMGR